MARACSRSWWCRNNERWQVGWVGGEFVGINLIIALVGVIVIELALGRWFAPYHPPSGFIFGQTFTLEQKFYQPHGIVTYVRDEYGLRGPGKGESKKSRLRASAGPRRTRRSSPKGETLGRMPSFAQTGIRITNAGDEGISSTGHVVAVVEWLHRIPNFRPRFYLHYIGLNDAAFAQAWTRPGSRDLIEAQIADQENRRALHRFIRGRSALVQGFIALKSWIGGPPRVFTASLTQRDPAAPEVRAEVDQAPIMRIREAHLRAELAAADRGAPEAR